MTDAHILSMVINGVSTLYIVGGEAWDHHRHAMINTPHVWMLDYDDVHHSYYWDYNPDILPDMGKYGAWCYACAYYYIYQIWSCGSLEVHLLVFQTHSTPPRTPRLLSGHLKQFPDVKLILYHQLYILIQPIIFTMDSYDRYLGS